MRALSRRDSGVAAAAQGIGAEPLRGLARPGRKGRGDTCRRLEAEVAPVESHGVCHGSDAPWSGLLRCPPSARARGWMRAGAGAEPRMKAARMSGEGDYNFRAGGDSAEVQPLLPGARDPAASGVGPRRTWLGPSRLRPGARPRQTPQVSVSGGKGGRGVVAGEGPPCPAGVGSGSSLGSRRREFPGARAGQPSHLANCVPSPKGPRRSAPGTELTCPGGH